VKRLIAAALLMLPAGCAELLYPLDHRAPWTVDIADLKPIDSVTVGQTTYAVFPYDPHRVWSMVAGGRWTLAVGFEDRVVSLRVAEGEVIATTANGHDCCVPSGRRS